MTKDEQNMNQFMLPKGELWDVHNLSKTDDKHIFHFKLALCLNLVDVTGLQHM